MIRVNNGYTDPISFLEDVDREFVERINNKITLYGQIPYTVPHRLIIELMKECALTMFRQAYGPAQQEIWFKIPLKEIVSFLVDDCACGQPECKDYGRTSSGSSCSRCKCNNQSGNHSHTKHHIHPKEPNSILPVSDHHFRGYAFKLPGFVVAVDRIIQVGVDSSNDVKSYDTPQTSESTSLRTESFSMNGGFSGSSGSMGGWGYYGGGGVGAGSPHMLYGINQHLYQIERTVQMTQANVQRSIMGNKYSVPHHFNRLTHTLMIHKKLTSDLMIKCHCNVPIQFLYEDDLFIKYVFARCKKELRRLLGGHTFQLPGDVQLSADEICSGADEEISQVEDVLKAYNGMGDVILFN